MKRAAWKNRSHFFHQLRILVRTGMNLAQSLPLAGREGPEPYRSLAVRWGEGCATGRTLAEQLAEAGEPPLVVALITAGERSGRLDEMCDEVVGFYDHAIRMRRQVVSKCIYPAVLLHAGLSIPVLPAIIGEGLNPLWFFFGPACLWALVLAVGFLYLLARQTPLPAQVMMYPPMHQVLRPLVVANTCLVVRGGLLAGMLMHEALDLAAGACGNRVYGERLRRASQDLFDERVDNLTTALGRVGFPAVYLNLVATGETGGELERTLLQAATVARESFQERVHWAARIVNATVYVIAMVVAVIAIFTIFYRIYSPAFEMMENM